MATASRTVAGAPAATANRMSLADISGKGVGLPNRYIIYAGEKWGKTSFGAMAPKPIFLMTNNETGLLTLIDAGQLPEIPHFPMCTTWAEAMGVVDVLTNEEHPYRTLVIDTGNGLERLCHEEVCRRDFNGDFSDKGFRSYMAGYEVALTDWALMLSQLDRLREHRKMSIVLLCHARIKPFRNPVAADYDRFQPAMHEKTWELCNRWADAIFFGGREAFVDEQDSSKKGKVTSTQTRIMHTDYDASLMAGNRLGLTEEIDMGNSPQEGWKNFTTALKAAKKGSDK